MMARGGGMWEPLTLGFTGALVAIAVIAVVNELIARWRARRSPIERMPEPWE
jgi:predicted PurR-regulated permease PerM